MVVSTKNRKEVLDLLKLRFNCLNRNITLRCFDVTNQQLLTYKKTNSAKNKIAGIYDLPDDAQRLLAEEIKGEEEYNAELRRKKANIDDAPFDFDDGLAFDNQKNDQVPAFGGFKEKKNKQEESGDDFSEMRQSVLVGFRKNSNIKYEDFQLKMLLGRGTFGKVYLAELVKQKKLYAIKAIRKDVLIEYNQVQNT